MSQYSIVGATDRLSDLIDRALAGEAVVITRDGQPVVELRPVAQAGKPVTGIDLDWVRANIVPSASSIDAVALVRQMRDADGD